MVNVEEYVRKAGEVARRLSEMIDALGDEARSVGELFERESAEITSYMHFEIGHGRFTVKENIEVTYLMYSLASNSIEVNVKIFDRGTEVHVSGMYFYKEVYGEKIVIACIARVGNIFYIKDYLKPADRKSEKVLETLGKIREKLPYEHKVVTTLSSVIKLPYRVTTGKTLEEYSLLPMEFKFEPRNFDAVAIDVHNINDLSEITIYNGEVSSTETIREGLVKKLPDILMNAGNSVAKIIVKSVEEEIVEIK